MERLKQQLQAEEIRFVENESLAAHCTFKIGGPADVFARPETEEQLCRVIALCKACDVKYYLLGNGSNILFEDGGYRGVVVGTRERSGGAEGDRTLDLRIANATLSQLSYPPIKI